MADGHFKEGLESGRSEPVNQRGMQRETGWLMGALVLKEPWAVLEALKISWFKAWFAERSKGKNYPDQVRLDCKNVPKLFILCS